MYNSLSAIIFFETDTNGDRQRRRETNSEWWRKDVVNVKVQQAQTGRQQELQETSQESWKRQRQTDIRTDGQIHNDAHLYFKKVPSRRPCNDVFWKDFWLGVNYEGTVIQRLCWKIFVLDRSVKRDAQVSLHCRFVCPWGDVTDHCCCIHNPAGLHINNGRSRWD